MLNLSDVAESTGWDRYFPRLNWHVLLPRLEQVPTDQRTAARDEIVRQWLEQLAAVYPGHYQVAESAHFFLLSPQSFPQTATIRFAAGCRDYLQRTIPSVEPPPGKVPILIWHDQKTYYRYVSWFYPEGTHGQSSGVHLRDEVPHVATFGKDLNGTDAVLAHELTHARVVAADLPLWIEEGLAQMAEHDLSGHNPLQLTTKLGAVHKRYWKRFGLDCFWRGDIFQQATRSRDLGYQLAEVLVRILLDHYRPRWFGLVRGHQQQLRDFFANAKSGDAGEAAARTHLGMTLTDLAAKFLGPIPG